MSLVNCNCVICAAECDSAELHSIALSTFSVTPFKICQACLNQSDPADDYKQVRSIVNSYLNISEVKKSFNDVHEILTSRK